MTETGWQVIARLARARRERLGLRQEQLRDYGGPGVATVGKIERAAQANFPTRTQQQLEQALGWTRGTIHDVIQSVEEGSWDRIGPDWEPDLVEHDVPDLTKTIDDEPAPPATRAGQLSDAELLAELTYRVRAYAEAAALNTAPTQAQVITAELGRRGRNPGWLMDATGLEVDELMPILNGSRPPTTRETAAIEKALGWAPGALAGPERAAPAGGQATTDQHARRDRAV